MKLFRRVAHVAKQAPAPTASPSGSPAQITPPQPKTLQEIEKEMALEAQVVSTHTYKPTPIAAVKRSLQRTCQKLIWTGVLVGIPVGIIALINLPYSPIRRPVAQTAPILLMPSYISMDHNFRLGVANVEAAKQLIDGATAPADLELGEQKLNQTQKNLDHLPTWVWSELPNTSSWWWYDWRLNRLGLNQSRAELGRLQGKLFQEKNAQTILNQAEQTLKTAEQQYKQAKTPIEQQVALSAWQTGLDHIQQVPPQTLAGKMAKTKIATAQRDFEAIGGLITSNQESLSLINAAKEFSWQAAQASQHPPHTVTEWQQVLDLRQKAIQYLKQVSPEDKTGYTAAQRLLAEYEAQQGQIRVRHATEAQAVRSFEQAQAQINRLIENTPRDIKQIDHSYTASQLQQIISQLETIDNGTTVYPEAQGLLLSAKQKLKQWQIQ